jgi:hypothetical protein
MDLGSSISYHPAVARAVGSTNAAILWQHLRNVGADRDYVCLSAEEIERDTALTYREQMTARRQLREAGYVAEQHKRLTHQLLFRVVSPA